MNVQDLVEPSNGALIAGRVNTGNYRARRADEDALRLGSHVPVFASCTYEFKRCGSEWVMASCREGSIWLCEQEIFASWTDVQQFLRLIRLMDIEYLAF